MNHPGSTEFLHFVNKIYIDAVIINLNVKIFLLKTILIIQTINIKNSYLL